MIVVYNGYLYEMAIPNSIILSKEYYHGVYNYEVAEFVLTNGIVPPIKSRQASGLSPLKGSIYITPKIYAAALYAREINKKQITYRYGFIFKIDGNELVDVYPDEDEIDSLMRSYLHYNKKITEDSILENPIPNFAVKIFDRIFALLSENEINTLINDFDLKGRIKICKKIVKMLLPSEILNLLNLNINISNRGKIIPNSVYVVDKYLLNSSGYSNIDKYSILLALDDLKDLINKGRFKDNKDDILFNDK